MKISDIKNILIKQTIIALLIIGVFVGAVLYLDSFNEDYDREINMLKSETDGIMQKVANLSLEYTKVVGNMAIYNDIKQKQDEKMLEISKIALRDSIAGTRDNYYIDNFDVKMDEIKPLTSDKYKRNTAFIEASNTTISVNGLTDVDILGLVKTLKQTFLGIKFTSLKLSLGTAVDNAVLISIKDSGFVPIINSKMTFTLFGLRNVTKDDNELLDGGGNQPASPADNNKNLIRLRQR